MIPGDVPLQLEIVPVSRFAAAAQCAPATLLGGLCFAAPAAVPGATAFPLPAVELDALPGETPVCELWHCAEPLRSGRLGGLAYRHGDTLMYGSISLAETARGADTPLQAATETAYRAIFELLEAQGYRSVLRFWNYFPAINQETHGIERYRQFNIGRQDAFLAQGRAVIGNVPAACALGSAGGGLHIAFLAARATVTSLENPRQLAAYHYPGEYGPRSPTFARAGLVRLGGHDLLFISGTASIVGHQTLHRGDAAAQTRECLRNIAAVVAAANQRAPDAGFRLDRLAYKVYVRHPDDLAAVRAELARGVGAPLTAIFLRAEICRADLLVEIEASGGHAVRSRAEAGAC